MSERSVLFLVSDLAPLTSVGRIRTQKMCKFLPKFGWRTSVLRAAVGDTDRPGAAGGDPPGYDRLPGGVSSAH